MSSIVKIASNLNRISIMNHPNILKTNLVFSQRILYSSSGASGSGQDDMSSCSLYDTRKYGHCLPANNVLMYFPPLPNIPSGIFRNTNGEALGLGAGKCCVYKNPEYFSYHHMTYYDFHLVLRCFRLPSPNPGKKP